MKKISIEISDKLFDGLERESAISSTSIDQLVAQKLDDTINQGDFAMDVKGALSSLRDYLLKIPSIKDTSISEDTGSVYWWVKFRLDIESKIAWQVIQELGHVLNYLSIDERLPVKFYPVSPPPYMNGGPEDYLSWIIESDLPYLDPKYIMSHLEVKLPDPVGDINEWLE